MSTPNPPLDDKGRKLLKKVQELLDAMLASSSGTALSVAQPSLVQAIDELARHRYAQIGVMEPHGDKR
jgi:hypothetical protein